MPTNPQLKKRMSEAVKEARPSLDVYKPPIASDGQAIPDIREVIVGPDLSIIASLVPGSEELRIQIKELKAARDKYTAEIKKILNKHRVSRFSVGEVPVNYYTAVRKKLNGVKLQAEGVPEAVIIACTDITETPTLRVGSGSSWGEE